MESAVSYGVSDRNRFSGESLAHHHTSFVLGVGDVLDQGVQVYLDIGIARAFRITGTVGGIVFVQSVGVFPGIRHTIAVSIGGRSRTVQGRPCTPVAACTGRLQVLLRIDDAACQLTAGLCAIVVVGIGIDLGCTVGCIVDHLGVVRVAMQAGTGILQYFLISLFGRVSSNSHKGNGFGNSDGILGLCSISPIVTTCINLLVDTHVPLVLIQNELGMLGVVVTRHVVFAPDVPSRIVVVVRTIAVGHILRCAYAWSSYAIFVAIALGGRTGLVVVVDNVHLHGLTAIATVSTKVIHDIVAHVHALVKLCCGTRTKTGSTAPVMGHQVVVV